MPSRCCRLPRQPGGSRPCRRAGPVPAGWCARRRSRQPERTPQPDSTAQFTAIPLRPERSGHCSTRRRCRSESSDRPPTSASTRPIISSTRTTGAAITSRASSTTGPAARGRRRAVGPGNVPFEARYFFHRFYHPYTRLFWHQARQRRIPAALRPELQQNPDQIDPSRADVFSFQDYLQARRARGVAMGRGQRDPGLQPECGLLRLQLGAVLPHPAATSPGCSARTSSSRTRRRGSTTSSIRRGTGTDPAPQRFWIPKPLTI